MEKATEQQVKQAAVMLANSMQASNDNTPIYSQGLRAKLEQLLKEGNIEQARKMFSCHKPEALLAISQFNTETHDIMVRKDKDREGKEDFRVAKLPRATQRRINNTGTFFMFGNPIELSLANDPDEAEELKQYFKIFKDYIEDHYFHEQMYEIRQITGAETECAKIYSLYKDEDGNSEVLSTLRYNSNGDTLYPLFNQYGKLIAFAVGYYLRDESLQLREHFEVYTSKYIWHFIRNNGNTQTGAWTLDQYGSGENPFGKIPVIYYNHEVDWKGSQERIDQTEWVDSKHADTTEYFGDPYLVVSSELVDTLADAREVGKLIEMDDPNGRFEYVTPPESSEMIKVEKDDLKSSIDEDTLSPDWSFKSIMGLGTLSGEAMRRANLPGYVKRTKFAVSTYNRLIKRDINLIKTILCRYEYLGNSKVIDGISRLRIKFDYTDPFIGGIEDNSTEVATFRGANAMSIHTAVAINRHVKDKEAEEQRIWNEIERLENIKAQASALAKIDQIKEQGTQDIRVAKATAENSNIQSQED